MAVDRRAARLSVLALVGLMLFSLLGARLWFLQTVKAEELEETSARARTRTVRVPPERGRIFDADGRILADNKRILTVAVDWQQLRLKSDRDEIFRRVSGWIEVPIEDMEARFQQEIDSPFLPMPLKVGVDEPTAMALLERIEDFPGLQIVQGWQRVYPYAPHAAHVVGYMGAITEEQLGTYVDRGYLMNERVGQFGVEMQLEDILHGAWGYTTYEVDAANRPVRVVEEVPPIAGFDVQLTIDLDLQQYVEQAVETTLEARRDVLAPNPEVVKPQTGVRERMDMTKPDEVPYKAPAGAGVIMNYETGEVLAMASYPTFDNRWFEAGLSSTKFQQIFPSTKPDGTPIDPDESILVNRAIQGRYNLGSAFKPFTAYAALSTGLLTIFDEFEDTGTYKLSAESVDPRRCAAGLIRCEYKNATCGNGRPCVYGTVTVEDALAVSSDAFFYSVGENIMTRNAGQPVLQTQVELFQYGSDTGIELPYEFDGTVPDRELKREYAERGVISRDEGRGYYVGDNVQLSIGQGLLSATPLQVANAYSALANGGTLLKPTIVKAIYHPGVPDGAPGFADLEQGSIFEDRSEPEVIREIPMPADIRDPIIDGLTRVIYGPGVESDYYHKTTGEYLFADYPEDAIPLAGKTGTAQGSNNYPWNDSSVFAAFSLDPTQPYVMSAYLEKSGYGSQAAAPVVKCTFLVLSKLRFTDPVVPSPPLDLNSKVAAPSMEQRDQTCWLSRDGNGVRTNERSVD